MKEARSGGFGYLFERFPSFTQTFCYREVEAMTARLGEFPIVSIREPSGEPAQDFPPRLRGKTIYVPGDLETDARRWLSPYAWRARRLRHRMVEAWGKDADRRRALEAAWIAPLLQAHGVRHVHVHFAGLAARTAFWLQRATGITYSFTAHANDFFAVAPSARLDDLFAEARFVIAVSEFSARQLRERFPAAADRIHCGYNGLRCSDFAAPRQPSRPPSIVSVGRYIEKKGYPDLIEACRRLGDVPFICSLVGDGPLEGDLRARIAGAGLEGKVFLTGPRSQDEIRTMLAGATVFALACRTESDGGKDNLPTVIMEAMAAGLPVVSTRLAGVPEMVEEGVTGLLVPEQDPAALADALRQVLGDPIRAEEMGAAGRRLARERFDLSVTSGALLDRLREYGAIAH